MRRWLLAVLAVLTGLLCIPASTQKQTLDARPSMPLNDSDGDLLPDDLEAVIFSDPMRADSDGDGRDDFVEAIEHTGPRTQDNAKAAPDGLRVLVQTSGQQGREVLWLHLLFRFRNGSMSSLKGLALFATDAVGNRYPLTSLIGLVPTRFVSRFDPVQGLLVRVTLQLPLAQGFQTFMPLTLGSYAWIGNRVKIAGSVLMYSGSYLTLVPVGKDANTTLMLQATNPAAATSPFWSAQKRCVLGLKVQGYGKTGKICEVKSAKCLPSQYNPRCSPSCANMKGQTFFVPDGMPMILGG